MCTSASERNIAKYFDAVEQLNPNPPKLSGALRTAAAAIAAVGALAIAGGVLAVGGLAFGGERPDVARGAPAAGGWEAPASFGPVSVQRIERFAGLRHGAGHAGANARSDRIRVSLTVTNHRQKAVPFSPGQLRLRLEGAGTTVPATNPNPPPGFIAAGQSLRQRLTFVVPAPRARFSLVFDDVNRATPLAIALGSLPYPIKE